MVESLFHASKTQCFHFLKSPTFLLRPFHFQEAQALAESWGVPYIECSSKTGENVSDCFHALLKEVSKNDDLFNEQEDNGCTIS